MKKNNKLLTKLCMFTIAALPNFVLAAGAGMTVPATISLTMDSNYYSQPTFLTSVNTSGELVCQLDSNDGGFTSAQAKWSQFEQVGTININGINYPIQKTNIPGIGAVARLSAQYSSDNPIESTQVINGEYKDITSSLSTGSADVYFGKNYWGLVALANTDIIPGIYTNELGTNQTGIDIKCTSTDGANETYGKAYLQGVVTINSSTCQLSEAANSNISIVLGNHSLTDVNSLNVNDTFGSSVKDLSLSCSAGSLPSLTITDNNNLNATNTSVIQLTPSGSDAQTSTAEGVGVKVFINGKSSAQQLNTPINLVNYRLKEETTVPVSAEFKYVKTSTQTTSGTANAVVNFTFTYN